MSSLFQCESSSEQNGQVFIPNISDFYFTPKYAGVTFNRSLGYTYIYNLPPQSAEEECSGTVVAMQYCYRTLERELNNANVFRFLYLTKCGLEFKIMKILSLTYDETNRVDSVSGSSSVCCHKISLSRQAMFNLSSLDNFTFGIEIRRAPLIAFEDITTEHNIEHFQAQLNDTELMEGSSFSLTESNRRSSVSPLLFRMFITIGIQYKPQQTLAQKLTACLHYCLLFLSYTT